MKSILKIVSSPLPFGSPRRLVISSASYLAAIILLVLGMRKLTMTAHSEYQHLLAITAAEVLIGVLLVLLCGGVTLFLTMLIHLMRLHCKKNGMVEN